MRRFSAYELNILNSHGIDLESISDQNIPVEYIVSEGEFCEYKFHLNQSTLIPRVETEYLIELGLKHIFSSHINYADIGCGSGAIGLTFGIELCKRNVSFDATLSDISEEALKVASKNYHQKKQLLGANKVSLIKSNLLKSYSKDKKLDLIFANLPYIPSSRIPKLDSSVRNYEPLTALDGGTEGLDFIKELLLSAKDYLTPKGVILFEVDDSHKDASIFSKEWSIEIKNDFNGKVRYWVCKVK